METNKLQDMWSSERLDPKEVFFELLRNWRKIATVTFVTLVGGLVWCFIAPKEYMAKAVVAAKDTQPKGGVSSMLGSLGGLSSLPGLNIGGSGQNLDKVEIILKSRELALVVLREHDLMPIIFKEDWDAEKKAWKDPKDPPTMENGADILRDGYLTVKVDNIKKVINMGISTSDPALCPKIVTWYLQALEQRVYNDAISQSEKNKAFLNMKASETSDPLLKEKIQQLIAMELEKAMLVISESFEVLEGPFYPVRRSKPDRRLIMLTSFLLGVMGSSVAIFSQLAYHRVRREWRKA